MQPTFAHPFVHLRIHSEYSIRDGLLKVKDIVQRAVDYRMPAVAITDRVNLFALVKFYRAALAAGIKPIVGADLLLREGKSVFPFTVLCQNQQGYRHLTQLISRAYLEGQQQTGEPTVEWSWLVAQQAGLIILSGGRLGDVGQAIVAGQSDEAKTRLQRWQACFGDRYYLELQRTGRPDEDTYLHTAVALAQAYQVPVVATQDIRFMSADDFEAHEARVCIQTSRVLEDSSRPKVYSEQQHFASVTEMQALFSDIPEALANTVEIAKRCTVELSLGQACLPQYPLPENVSLEDYIQQQSEQGLQKRLASMQGELTYSLEAYRDRLKIELDVINSMGFPGYFLIVADFIQWAKDHDIPVGPGRGSGAGSLVAYVLGITELDPLEHQLLFERFLNPERVSMPDFDIDFCMEGRDRVIDYVAERYGRDSVSQIITYGTMAAKAVVRDVGRVLGMPYGFVDKIAKLIPFELGITLDKALEQEPVLQQRYREEEEVTTLMDLAKKLEGLARNAGKHAGGVVIAPTKLTDFAPLYCEANGDNVVTQFDKDDVEAVGLVKFDFLGLRTLTIIHWAVQNINQQRQAQQESLIDIQSIPLDDRKSFELLQSCATTAVFQLESRGMKELIRRLKPDSFEEITALVALFRPGPLQSGMVDDFIARKHGEAPVLYPHPEVEAILKPTYGVILYQEQVMQIAQVLAGYSLGGADILRRAMGKKKPEEMAKQREVFITGATGRGIDASVAEHIFDLMEKFAGYGFNKSHSAAYALIAYQTAWLKAHYPAEFMAAVLSSDMDNTDKVVSFIEECHRMGLVVKPPAVNLGHYKFTVNAVGEIEYGLGAIKGVGEAALEAIIAERQQGGDYRSLFDFCRRLDTRKVSRRVIEPLVRCGAFDSLQEERSVLFASIDKALKAAEQQQRDAAQGQLDLFSALSGEATVEIHYEQVDPWNTALRLQYEKETLGWYISGHPLQLYEAELQQLGTKAIADCSRHLQQVVSVAGILMSIRVIQTKTGKRMAVLSLEDRSGRIEVTVFSKLYEEHALQFEKDAVYVVKAKVEADEYSGGVRLIAEALSKLSGIRERRAKQLRIVLAHSDAVDALLPQLADVFAAYRGGSCPVMIAYGGEAAGAELALGEAWQVQVQDDLLWQLRQVVGEDAVSIRY